MKLLPILPIALLLASPLAAEKLPNADPRQAGFDPDRIQRIRAVLQRMVVDKEFAGINVAVARNGKVAYRESFGYRDLESNLPMEPDTIFRIYSMTKPIVSAAVMMLYEEGKFLLDDPVSKYIPGFDKVKVLRSEDGDGSDVEDQKTPVTIQHLLTHTSGLSNNRAYQAAKVFAPDITLAEMAKRLVTVPLAHQPGEAWRYAQSINVLGYLVEVWSGRTLDVFLEQRIFEPLGMKDTAFYVPSAKLSRLAKLYRLNESGKVEPAANQGRPAARPTFLSGSGGLYSTIDDYLRFCQMLLNGGELDGKRLLGRLTVEYMMRNHVAPGVIPPNGPNGRRGYGFGLGGAVLMNPAEAATLSAEGEFTWGGAAGTYFWIDPRNGLIAVWLVQRPPFVPQPSKKFKGLVYQALE